MSTGGRTSAGRSRGPTLVWFSSAVTVVGLVVAGIIGLAYLGDRDLDPGPIGRGGDYARQPWTDPDPVAAEQVESGTYDGPDGAVIRLSGLDVDTPLTLIPQDGTSVSSVRVTGPGGKIVTQGENGDPPRFYPVSGGQIVVIVEQPDVELWVSGRDDENWRLSVRTDPIPPTKDVFSASQTLVFRHDGTATAARVTARGEGSIYLQAITVHGSDSLPMEAPPFDQTIAWKDTPYVVFSVESLQGASWRIRFPNDQWLDPTPEPTP